MPSEAREEEEWSPKVIEGTDASIVRRSPHEHGRAVQALASYELLGEHGSTAALRQLEEVFVDAIQDRSDEFDARMEYRRALDGARKRVQQNESTVLAERQADEAFSQAIIEYTVPSDQDDFWDQMPVLADIRDKAYARMASPWAVLGVALARIWPSCRLRRAPTSTMATSPELLHRPGGPKRRGQGSVHRQRYGVRHSPSRHPGGRAGFR